MRRRLFILAILLSFMAIAIASAKTIYQVKYVSAENIYLSGGSLDGLVVGDTLSAQDSNSGACRLVVAFTANHSASCEIVSGNCTFTVGQKFVRLSERSVSDTSLDTTTTTFGDSVTESAPTPVTPTVTWTPPREIAKVTAHFYAQYYVFDDQAESNLDLSQFTGRLSLRARELFGQPLTLSIRTRGRYDQRERQYASGIPQSNWATRIWDFSLSYESPQSPMSFQMGRISPRRAGGVGLLDGALVEYGISESVRFGAFGGSQPSWAYSDNMLPLTRAGMYVFASRKFSNGSYWEQSVAGVGEYSGGEVNRELLVSQGRVQLGGKFSAFHTLEMDLNRSWRLDKTSKSVTISSVYAGAHYRFTRAVRFGINYDNRTNYWTLQSRSVVDSLFDDRLRQGVRFIMELSLPSHIRTNVSYGIRNRESDPSTTNTYSLFISKSLLLRKTTTGSVHWSSFDGPFEKGKNYTVRVGDYIHHRVYSSVAYGGYSYTVTLEDAWRSNNWIELSSQADLGKHSSLNSSVEFDSGDDLQGVRFLIELGYSL